MLGISEEELTIESNTIPWLIFTQLIVLLLLFALLFFFTLFPSDPNNLIIADTPSSTTSSNLFFFDDIQQIHLPLTNYDSSPTHPTITRQHPAPQGEQKLLIKSEITGPSIREEEIMEEEDSSVYFHPCRYFQLATVAFLKCFGLDSTSDIPSTRRHSKRKES